MYGAGLIVAPQGGTVNITGMSLSDGISLFKELYELNMPRLRNEAAKIAEDRVNALWESFAQHAGTAKLSEEELNRFAEPEVQASLAIAVKTSALREESVIRESLAALLVKKLRHDREDLKRIILTESISTIGKLTTNQIRTLALVFLAMRVVFNANSSWEALNANFQHYMGPFLDVKVGLGDLQHIAYAGCGIVNSVGIVSPDEIMRRNYPWLFFDAINLDQPPELTSEAKSIIEKYGIHQGNGYKFEISAILDMRSFLRSKNIPENVLHEVALLIDKHQKKARPCIIQNSPIGAELLRLWDATDLKHLSLTSVGMALAISLIEQVTSEKLDLNHWFS